MRLIMWHSLIAVGLITLGFIMALIQSSQTPGHPSPMSGILMLIGFVWFVLNRLRMWWLQKQRRTKE